MKRKEEAVSERRKEGPLAFSPTFRPDLDDAIHPADVVLLHELYLRAEAGADASDKRRPNKFLGENLHLSRRTHPEALDLVVERGFLAAGGVGVVPRRHSLVNESAVRALFACEAVQVLRASKHIELRCQRRECVLEDAPRGLWRAAAN